MRTRLVGGAALGLATAAGPVQLRLRARPARGRRPGLRRRPGHARRWSPPTTATAPASRTRGETFWKGVVDEFQAANPNIKVDVQVINWNDIDKQVATMVQNGQVPDILQTGDYSGFVGDQLLYKVDEVLSPDDLQPTCWRSSPSSARSTATAYGIPFVSSARALFYNKELFAKAEDHRPAEDLGRAQGRRREAEGRRRQPALRPPARPGGGPGRVVPVDARQRRRLQGRLRQVGDQLPAERRDLQATSRAWSTPADHPEPGHQGPQDRLGGLRRGQGRHGQRWTDVHPDLRRGRPEGLRRRAHPRQGRPARHHPRRHGLDHGVNKNGHAAEIKKFFDFFYTGTAAQKISDTYKLLPVTKGGIRQAVR